MKLVQKITLVTTIIFAANLANLAFPFFTEAAGDYNTKVEVHLISVNIDNDSYTATTGVSRNWANVDNPRPVGDFAESFGSPYGMMGLTNYQDAVRYGFSNTNGNVNQGSIAVSADTFDAGATVYSDTAGVTMGEGTVTDPITLPFPVGMFNETTNTIVIGSKGFIYAESGITPGFTGDTGGCCSGQMQTQDHSDDDFMVAGVWSNLDPTLVPPSGNATIKTEVFGTAPQRRFVIQFENVEIRNYHGTQTFQIKLFEVPGGPGYASSTGTGEETIDPGILQLTGVPANFNFPGVNIVNLETYNTTYVNQQTDAEKLTAEDRRFSGGFEVQMTATEYVGQTDPANKIPVSALGVLTQVPNGTTDYMQTTQLQNGYSDTEGNFLTGSDQFGAVLTQSLPFSFPMFGRESNQIYICTSGFIVQAANLAGFTASDFNDLCLNMGGPPAGEYSYMLPYLAQGSELTTQRVGGGGGWNPDNGVYYNQVSDNEVHVRYKANARDKHGDPVGSVEFTVYMFRDGRIEYHEGPNDDTTTTPTIAIGDNGTSTFIQASEAPFGLTSLGADIANAQIRFTPSTTIFNDVKKTGTPPVYAATFANSTSDPVNFTMFTEDTENPGFSIPVTTLEGAACTDQGRLGNYTVYPSFILRIPPTTLADTYQNTITFTIIDKTYNFGSGFCGGAAPPPPPPPPPPGPTYTDPLGARCCVPQIDHTIGITNITLLGDNRTLQINNDSLAGNNIPNQFYTDFTTSQTSTPTDLNLGIPDLMAGGSYGMSISNDPNSVYGMVTSVWIDYNHDGTFDISEKAVDNATVDANPPATPPLTPVFTVPALSGSVLSGNTRMRIGTTNWFTGSGRTVDDPQPTIPESSPGAFLGEFEDYTVNITVP